MRTITHLPFKVEYIFLLAIINPVILLWFKIAYCLYEIDLFVSNQKNIKIVLIKPILQQDIRYHINQFVHIGQKYTNVY